MRCKHNFIFYTLLIVAVLFTTRIKAEAETVTVTDADIDSTPTEQNETTTTTTLDGNSDGDGDGDGDGDELDLESMTNEELEEICTSRGFDVVKEKDEESGETMVYSHEDYVTAAQQCLDIAAEMEELLSENPELIQEIEAEAEKMKLENQRLENEIANMIKDHSDVDGDADADVNNEEVDKLRQEKERLDGDMENLDLVLDAARHVDESSNANDNANAAENMDENADGESRGESQSTSENEEDNENIGEGKIMEGDSEEVLDLDVEDNGNQSSQEENNEDTTSNDSSSTENTPEQANSSNFYAPSDNTENPFTIAGFASEVRKQVGKDFTFVADLILPKVYREPLMESLQPVLEAVKPAVQILQEGVSTVVDMVKRNTSTNTNEEVGQESTVIDEGKVVEGDSEDVIDLDVEDGGNETSQEENNEDTSNDSSTENTPEQANSSNANTEEISPSKNTPFTIGDLVSEVRDQIANDFNLVADLILPKSARGPLLEAVKPAVRIVQEGVSTVVDMVKRYAPRFLREEGEGKDNNSNAVAALS